MSLFFFPSGSPPPLFTLPYKNGRPAPGRWRRPGQRRYGRPEAAVHEAAAGQRVRGFLFFSFLPSARIRRRLIAFPPWRARGGTPGRRSIGLPTPGRALARTELTAGLHCDPSASPPPRARASRKFRVTAFSPTRPPDLLFLPPSPTSRSADGTPGSTTPARTPHQATSLADLLANTTVSELMRPQVRRGEGEERGEGRGSERASEHVSEQGEERREFREERGVEGVRGEGGERRTNGQAPLLALTYWMALSSVVTVTLTVASLPFSS